MVRGGLSGEGSRGREKLGNRGGRSREGLGGVSSSIKGKLVLASDSLLPYS